MNAVFWLLIALVGGGLALLLANDSAGQTFGMDNGDFAQMISLGAFGILVGTGLLSRRVPLSETARNIALWLLAAVVLVAGYQYRYELQDVASRVTAGLVPGSPISLTDAEGRDAVYLDRAPGGHFEARAVIDGAQVQLVVDTGASSTVLTAEDARRIGIDPDSLSYWVTVTTANGAAQAARVQAREIAVGAIARRDVTMLVARPGALGQSLLGMNFIGTLSGFDMRGDRLILRD